MYSLVISQPLVGPSPFPSSGIYLIKNMFVLQG